MGAAILIVLGAIVVSPFLALVQALFRGLILGLPVMLVLGWLHTNPALAWIPDLGFWASAGIVAILSLLIPTSSSSSSSKK
jgi:hypothetical protein